MFTSTVPTLPAPIRAKIRDFVESLRAVDAKIGKAMASFDAVRARDNFDTMDLYEIQASARVFVRIFAGMAGKAPTQPARVFETFRTRRNVNAKNSPHVEGAIEALGLAFHSMVDADREWRNTPGPEFDPAIELMTAAITTIRAHYVFMTHATLRYAPRPAASRPVQLAAA